MYLAKMTDALCGAKYYYKDNSMYFNIDFPLDSVDSFALHECIHYLQEVKDENGNLIRLGLYNFEEGQGMAINEAAVQLMTVTALDKPILDATYYGLSIPSNSIDCYPLECAIIRQMSYFTGTYPLFHSTINGNDIFKNTFIAISDKKTYKKIELNLDKMLDLENYLAMYFEDLKYSDGNVRKVKKINSAIVNTKNKIADLFLKCQNEIISVCFSKEVENVHNLTDIKLLKNKAYNFKNLIATNSTYSYYNEFYRHLMEVLDEKASYIQEHGPYNYVQTLSQELIVPQKYNKVFAFFRKVVSFGIFSKRRSY
ncbi:MAG: hypothetical protein IKP28_06840 [Clostridia bacterium]|nr:hypothetical protein [Clostridia bacterium]